MGRSLLVPFAALAIAAALALAAGPLVECEGLSGLERDRCVRDAAVTAPLAFSDDMVRTCREADDAYLQAECIAILAYRLVPLNSTKALSTCGLVAAAEPRSACLGLVAARLAQDDPLLVARESAQLPPSAAKVWLAALVREHGAHNEPSATLALCTSLPASLQRTCIEDAIEPWNASQAHLCERIPYRDLARRCAAATLGRAAQGEGEDGTVVALVVLLAVGVGTLAVMHIEVKHYR